MSWSEGASPLILLVRGGGLGFFFQAVFDVESELSTIHFSLGQSTLHASFFLKKYWGSGAEGERGGGQSKEFPIAPQFYPICQSKCCPPFTYVGERKGK